MGRARIWSGLIAAAAIASTGVVVPGEPRAADLSGDCCADLEEVVEDAAEDGHGSRKGNRRIKLIKGTKTTLAFGPGSFSLALPSLAIVALATSGQPAVVSGSHVAVVDTTGFANVDRSGIALTTGIDQLLAGALVQAHGPPGQPWPEPWSAGASPGASQRSDAGPGTSSPGWSSWAAALGGYSQVGGSGPLFASDQSLGGVLSGVHLRASRNLVAGMYAGGARSALDADFDAERGRTDYAVAGFYGRVSVGGTFLDFSLAGAWSETDGRRRIASNIAPGAWETARADYDGWLVSPAIGAGWLIPIDAQTTLIPVARVRYLLQHLDGYSETGSTANLSVGDRDLGNVEGRLELGLQSFVLIGDVPLLVRAKVGAILLMRTGDRTVGAVLLGTPLLFHDGSSDTEGGAYVGAGFDYQLSPTLSLFSDAELVMSGDAAAATGSLGLRLRF